MQLKKIILALFACMALGAVAANAAQAAGSWKINGTAIPNGTHQGVKCSKHGSGKLVFTGTLLTKPVEITANQVDCLKEKGSTEPASIDNTTSGGHSEGVLTFTEVEVITPEHCEVANHELTTNKLTDTMIMDPKAGSVTVFDRFFPEKEAEGFISIEFTGALCTLAEDIGTVKGSACGEAVHTNISGVFEESLTGEERVVQSLRFGAAQQETATSAAEPCALTFGGAAAQLTGAVDNELTAPNAGVKFGW